MSTCSAALSQIVGNDPNLRLVLARAARVAPTRMPVLVTGESGTGKELFARLLHELGPAPGGPFVAVNCSALARELAESELFGHERGAFTGAGSRRRGWFEEASGGTLVLDEVGELPGEAQAKLLRVLETARIRRVGGSGEVAVEVRVIAMTLRDIAQDTARGAFRLDLYHRLAGFELRLPPLRQRRGDILPLARRFLDEMAPEVGPRTLDNSAVDRLVEHPWPGNVRELRNVVRRAALLSSGVVDAGALEITPASFDARLACRPADADDNSLFAGRSLSPCVSAETRGDTLNLRGKTHEQIQSEVFLWALQTHGNSRRKAAASLGISRSTFCDRLKRLGVVPPKTAEPRQDAAGANGP